MKTVKRKSFIRSSLVLIGILLMLSSCNVIRYIGGDKRWIKHDLGLSTRADSIMIPQNKSYKNENIFDHKTGILYTYNVDSSDSISTNFIAWENKWYTIVVDDIKGKQLKYYTYDKKNRLRKLDRYSKLRKCYTSSVEFNKKGKVIFLDNGGIWF